MKHIVRCGTQLKIICTIVALCLTLTSKAQSLRQVATWAKALFVVSSADQKDYKVDHEAALRYVRRTSKPKLRRDLKAVFTKYGINQPEGAGAAYLMAMHGVDVQENLTQLENLKQFDVKKWNETCFEAMPSAYADLVIRLHSARAAHDLVAMETDGDVGEMQAYAIRRAYLREPDLMVGAAAQREKLTTTFLFQLGMATGPQELKDVRRVARSRITFARGRAKNLYGRLLTQKPDQWQRDYTDRRY